MIKNMFPESREDLISMFLGLGVVVVAIGLIVNLIIRTKGSVSLPGLTTSTDQISLTKPGESAVRSEEQNTYIVKRGDSLWSIAETIYKDGYQLGKIAKANNLKSNARLEVGQKLALPTKAPVQTVLVLTPTVVVKEVPVVIVSDSYRVLKGDSLWKIAVSKLGNGYKWVEIWNLNKKVIADPNRLEVGMVLKLK